MVYAAKLLWPFPTIFFYPRWDIDATARWQYLFPVNAITLPLALFLARRAVGLGPLAGVLIFGGVTTPMLGFINVYFHRFWYVADHFLYHASPALIALFGAGAATGYARFSPRFAAEALDRSGSRRRRGRGPAV